MKSTGNPTENLFLGTIKEQLSGCSFPVRIICALSGGADSTILLLLLSKYSESLGILLEAAYVNHGIRDAAVLAAEDRTVESLCASVSVPLHTKHLAPGFLEWYASRKGIGTEAAAREYRYRFLNKLMLQNGRECRLALGHNRNDQEETVVMRFFSGAGLQGLQGIPRYTDRIIRPLIDMDRSRIEEYLEQAGVSAVDDESNSEDDYLRNRVRNRVLPRIRDYFPHAGDSLLSLSTSMGELLDHYGLLVDKICPWRHETGRFSCSREDFQALPAVTRRMVLLKKRNSLLKGRRASQRIPSSFLNPLDTMKSQILLKGYGILFYSKKDRLILEDGRLHEERPSLFYHLTADHSYTGEYFTIVLEEDFSPYQGCPEDMVLAPGTVDSLFVVREEGAGKKVFLCCRTEALLCLSAESVGPLNGVKIEKRIDSGGLRGLPCVIIKERG